MSSEGGRGTKVMTYRDDHESYSQIPDSTTTLSRLEQAMRIAYRICLFIYAILLLLLNLFFILCVGFFANAVLTDCQAMQDRLFEVYFLVFSKKVNRHLIKVPCLGKIGKRKFPHKLIRPVNFKKNASLYAYSQTEQRGTSLIERNKLTVSLEAKLGFSFTQQQENVKTIVCLQDLTKRSQDHEFLMQVFKEISSVEQKDLQSTRLVYLDTAEKTRSQIENVHQVKQTLSRLERQELIRNASCLLCPSHFNGFDISVLEAMHLGCPVVASVTGSAAEFLDNGHSGFTLINDVQLWTRQIKQIMSPVKVEPLPYVGSLKTNIFGGDESRQSSNNVDVVKQNAREQVQSLFSETLFTESLLMILNEL